jgi:translocation and assembly module TamB
MIFRQFSLIVSKYLAILLCLITVLLTTPWGTQLTLLLLNNIDGITFDYHSGALVRDVQLNSFHVNLEELDISIEGLSTKLDFSCAWKKKLCIKSAEADSFSLRYLSSNKNTAQASTIKSVNTALFEMPFSIEADAIGLKETHLIINNNDIAIVKFSTKLSINQSDFSFFGANADQLTVSLDISEQEIQATDAAQKTPVNNSFTLPEINLPISLTINQLYVDDIKVVTTDNQNSLGKQSCQPSCQQWHSSNNHLSGHWVNSDVSISQFKTTTSTFSIKQMTADAKLFSPYQLNTQLVSQINTVPWWPEIANTTQALSIQGSFDDLNYDLISKGKLALKSQGKINLLVEDMPFDIKVNAENIPTPVNLSKYGQYSSLALHLSGDLKHQKAELTSKIKAYGYNSADVKLSASHQNGHFIIDEFFFDDIDSTSQLDFHGDIAIVADDITWQLSANSTGFALPPISMQFLTEFIQDIEQVDALASTFTPYSTGRLKGKIISKGTWTDKTWSVLLSDTELLGHINDIDLTIKADFGVNQLGDVQPGQLFINFNDSALTLHASDNKFWDLKGQLSVDNINQWHLGVDGGFISNFSVSGNQENPAIKLKTQLTEIKWQQWHSNLLSIDASYQPMRDHTIQLTVNNDQLHWAKEVKRHSVDNLLITVDGNATRHQISAQWLGDLAGELSLTGHFDNNFTQWKSSIENSALRYQQISLQSDKAFDVDVDVAKKQVVIGDHCWLDNSLAICLPEQATLGESGNVAVTLDVDLSEIDELFLPKDTELISQVNGDIKLKWSNQKPLDASAELSLSSGYLKVSDEFNEHKLSQWSQGLFTFAIDAQQLTSKLLLNDISDLPLVKITSKVDFIENASFNNSTINAKILLNDINLQPLQSIITNVVILEGKVNAEVAVNGTIKTPLLNGELSLNKGKLQIRQNANTLANISSSIAIKANQAIVAGKFFIEDKEANLLGDMSWQDGLSFNLDLTADTLPLVFPPQLMMSISPKLNFQLIEKALTISGNIDVLEGIYNIERLSDSSVSLSDDVIILDNHGKAIIKESSGFDIKTDIKVNIGKAFEISGQGLHSHLFGQLQISQHDKHPFQMFGKIQSVDGTFQAYGQKLKIEKGELAFNGPIDNPYFNLRASRHIKAEDIDVGMQVTGLADELDFKLFSTPTMEMPEMLSYLVRGRSLDAGTENSTAAASFLVGFGATNSVGLFDRIEEIPLISNIAVDTEGEGEKTQATVSGYLGNRVYLKYGIGVYEPINELTVRMFILNRFWLEIVSGIEQSTDLYYSFYID